MKNLVNLSGSIAKKEILIPLQSNIAENTFICEATNPYAFYYGRLPQKPNPNSLFLFTNKFYFLEEILSCAQQVEKCLLNDINIASAIIECNGKQYPAIRIKNFPDYSLLRTLQTCLLEQGIKFASKLNINGEINARINKLFVLEEIEPGIYMDMIEDNKGYFIHDIKLSPTGFEQILKVLKNNTACKLFDAVQGEILQDGNVLETVRVYAEGLEPSFLKCIAVEFRKRITLANTLVL